MLPQRLLGNTGLYVSALGFGAASIGFAQHGGAAEFVHLIQHAVDQGITFFDTAPDYRHSEEWLGQALRDRRHDVVLATKVGRSQTWNGSAWDVREDWSEAGVLSTIDASLERLETEYLDVVQLHSPHMWVLDDGAAVRGLQHARAMGKVRHIGVSADGDEAQRAVEMRVFETLQTSYSILQQAPGDDLLPQAVAQGMGVIIKQPIANGVPLLHARPTHPDWACKWDVSQGMPWHELDADRLGVALRWVLANPLVSTAIVGVSQLAHLRANLRAAQQSPLDPTDYQRIRAAYLAAQPQEPA